MKCTTKSIRRWGRNLTIILWNWYQNWKNRQICKEGGAMNLFFASNIGIIGGADGPTAVFVSGSLSVWFWVGVGIAAAAIVSLFVYWFKKRK